MRAPVKTPAEQAEARGLSIDEMKEVSHKSRLLGSDFHHNRPTSDADFAYLIDTATKNSKIATDILWGFLPLKGSKYDAEIFDLALKCAESPDDSVAFAAINLMQHYGDKRWESFANAHVWKWPELKDALFEPHAH